MKRRSLIVPPIFHTGDSETSRKATWLELFFDLAYVAAVIELGYVLTGNVTLEGIVTFVLLFIPVWWSWVGTTFFANRFDSDDLIHRLLIFLQIFALSSLAINLTTGLNETFIGFAISYAVVRLLFILMYVRAYLAVPSARALVGRYILGFGAAALLWLVAAVLPAPLRFVVVGIAVALDFSVVVSRRSRQLQGILPPSPSHLPERFGLFTIIVLGELFLKVTRELSGTTSSLGAWATGFALFVVAIGLWWLYFNRIVESKVQWGGWRAMVWLFAHLPLHIALTAFGVGFAKVVMVPEGDYLRNEYRLLTFGALAVGLTMILILTRTLPRHHSEQDSVIEPAGLAIGAIILAGLALFGGTVDHLILSLVAALVMIVQIVINLVGWLTEPEEGANDVSIVETLQ